MLLQNRDLLPLTSQRLAAIFLLYELYRSDPISANPFAAFLVELLQPSVEDLRGAWSSHALSLLEKHFLSQLATSTVPREVRRCGVRGEGVKVREKGEELPFSMWIGASSLVPSLPHVGGAWERG